VVEQELDNTSFVFDALTCIAPKLELKLVGFSMEKARDAAWCLAKELAPLAPQAQGPNIGRRDGEAALIGMGVLNDGLIIRLIRAGECKDVAQNIRTLAQGEFRNTVPAVIAPPAPAPSPAPAT
jgi:hypothetical protein